MGIVIHDVNEVLLDLRVPGAQSIAADQDAVVVPYTGTIRGILARLDTAGTVSGSQTTDIKLNGTSIFSGVPNLDFAVGSKSPTYGALATDPTPVTKGDTLVVHTTAVHGTPGKNLAITLTVRRGLASSQGTDTDSVSAMSDAL